MLTRQISLFSPPSKVNKSCSQITNGHIKPENFIKIWDYILTHILVGSSTFCIFKKKLSAILEYSLKLDTLLANKSLFSCTTHLLIFFYLWLNYLGKYISNFFTASYYLTEKKQLE